MSHPIPVMRPYDPRSVCLTSLQHEQITHAQDRYNQRFSHRGDTIDTTAPGTLKESIRRVAPYAALAIPGLEEFGAADLLATGANAMRGGRLIQGVMRAVSAFRNGLEDGSKVRAAAGFRLREVPSTIERGANAVGRAIHHVMNHRLLKVGKAIAGASGMVATAMHFRDEATRDVHVVTSAVQHHHDPLRALWEAHEQQVPPQ